MNDEIWLSDMSKCLPFSALSRTARKYHWKLIDYETEKIHGMMLSAGPETDPPDVTYPMDLQGWYSIYIGLWAHNLWHGGLTKIKLSNDATFSYFKREKPWSATLEEGFWKHADLTDQNFVIGQPNFRSFGVLEDRVSKQPAYLAYIKLVSLSDEQISSVKADRSKSDSKILIGHNDGGTVVHNYVNKESLVEPIERFRNTDFKKIFYEIGVGDCVMFPNKLGRKLWGEGLEDFGGIGWKVIAENIQKIIAEGINPIKVAIDYAHELDLEFHVCERIENFMCPLPHEELITCRFYKQHPELHLFDRDGTEVSGLSYAYPEVRDYHISLLKEAASFGADGAVPIFMRGAPFLLYEKPIVDGFKDKSGKDPRDIIDDDEDWLRYRATFMTKYMQELRLAMDEVGSQLGKRLEISAIILPTKNDNLFFGLDPEVWIREGLVDNLIPYPTDRDEVELMHRSRQEAEIDMAYFRRIKQGSKCKIYPNVMPRIMPAEEFRKKALYYYDEGADGLYFWDVNERQSTTSRWPTLSRLGHKDELKKRVKEERQEAEPKLITLKKLSGFNMQRYWPYRGT